MRRGLVAFPALVLLAFAVASTTAPAADPVAGSAKPHLNPHGSPDHCDSCHLPLGPVPAPGPGAPGLPIEAAPTVGAAMPIVATCRGCHPTADMHPVGMKPNKEKVPAGWPLEDGKVVCSTCHEEPAHGGKVNTVAPYHRGGPYPNKPDMCWQCHQRTTFDRSEPHHPATLRDSASPSCSACHAGYPTTGASVEKSRLRVDPHVTCTATCHKGEIHSGVPEHLGKVVPDEVRAKLPPTIALPADGKIACFTCHEVHGDTAAAEPRAPSRLARELRAYNVDVVTWPGEGPPTEQHVKLATDRALCKACHGEGP